MSLFNYECTIYSKLVAGLLYSLLLTCRPRELSSKKPVSRFREVVPAPKKSISDPRFDEKCGLYNEDLFQKSYSFISEMKKKEKLQVQKELRKTKKAERKKELETLLQKMVCLMNFIGS